MNDPRNYSVLDRLLRFFLEQKLVVALMIFCFAAWGLMTAPFDWELTWLPRDPVPVDAIPDIGENQQIVFTEWMGRSPQDVEDQITYPLTVSLLGVPGVKTIRSYSMFGFSSIYVIFAEDVDFYWSRTRILEKLNSLPAGVLPEGVRPALGPDATALGQIFWYTLEGRDERGNPTGGWDLHELRTVQDWQVRYALLAAEGVSEVASVGGFVQEYQIDVDPDAMRAYGVTLDQVFTAVRMANRDVGARTIEVNKVEYVIRGIGFIKRLEDLENAVIRARNGVPIYVGNVARVSRGPAYRDGALDKEGAVLTAVSTTVVGFLPVFTMEGAEGKLFRPLAFTKTFALIASVLLALTVIPALAHVLFTGRIRTALLRRLLHVGLIIAGLTIAFTASGWAGLILVLLGVYYLTEPHLSKQLQQGATYLSIAIAVAAVTYLLAAHWLPLGPDKGTFRNLLFVAGLLGSILFFFYLFQHFYRRILGWCLEHKLLFMALPAFILLLGATTWLGFDRLFGWLPRPLRAWGPVSYVAHEFPGLGKEFMPPLDEGAFLFMPTTMPHASIGEALDVLQKQDMAITQIPEVESAVGKLGRAATSLDPAPISMIETIINYYPEYLTDDSGHHLTFSFDPTATDFARSTAGLPLPAPDGQPYITRGRFLRDAEDRLIPDPDGKPFRLWRPPLDPELNPERAPWPGVRSPEDIWDAIVRAAEIPGTTSAPMLQPIAARIVMLQSGMRAPMGIKVRGPDLETIERFGLQLEKLLKEVPSVTPAAVNAERIVGKPYLEIRIDRRAIARYGIMLGQVQDVIEVAIGGVPVTTTVEGRQRYPVRVRYLRELRDQIESLERILAPAPDGTQIPLGQLASIEYVRGPQMIKSEDTFLVGYVLFDKKPGYAEVDVVEQCQKYLRDRIASGELELPAGVSYVFAGSYENQLRAQKKLTVVLPLALFLIFLILYFQFNDVPTTLLVFFGIVVAWAGGFLMLWLYGQNWFLDFSILDTPMRELFQIHPVNLSVAVWVGFLALFGIASDDGVIMATYLRQSFAAQQPSTRAAIRQATLEAGLRRVRPCLMTISTTILALIPVLTSSGRGADIMVPMAIPTFGGMTIAVMTILIVPVLYCAIEEFKLRWTKSAE